MWKLGSGGFSGPWHDEHIEQRAVQVLYLDMLPVWVVDIWIHDRRIVGFGKACHPMQLQIFYFNPTN